MQSVNLTTTSANDVPLSAPRRIAFAVVTGTTGEHSMLPVEVAVSVTPVNDAPKFWGVGAVKGAASVEFPESAPPDIWLLVAPDCAAASARFGAALNATTANGAVGMRAPTLCFTDKDTLLGRARTGDSYFGGDINASVARDEGGAGVTLLSNYTLTLTPNNISWGGGCTPKLSAAPILGALYTDCGESLQMGGARDVTTAAGASSWMPHAPWAALQTPQNPSAAYPAAGVMCVAQRYRVTVTNPSSVTNASSRSPRMDDGCGTWGAAAPGNCAIDAQPAYCDDDSALNMVAAASSGAVVTVLVTATLYDTFSLDYSTATATASLNITLVSAPEPPVIGWADVDTLDALGLLVQSPQLPVLNQILIDDMTGEGTSASALAAPLVLCSQREADFSGGIAVVNVSAAVEDASAANITAVRVGDYKLLRLASAPACLSAFTSSGEGVIAAAPSGTVWVSAYTLRAATATLNASRVRALTVSVSARAPSRTTLTAAPLAVPIRITRANQPVRWSTPTAAVFSFIEHAPPGTSSGDATVFDADVSQDIAFSVVNATLQRCGLVSPTGPVRDWSYLFALAPLPRTVPVFDVATGVSTFVNASRSASLVIAADGLDIGEFAAACSLPAFPRQSSCIFAVTLRAVDSGNASATHSLLPPTVPTSADVRVTVSVALDPNAAPPVILGVLGAPSGGLSPRGGDELTFFGTNLGLPVGNTSIIQVTLETSRNGSFPLACSILVRQTHARCITTPGWGTNLSVSYAISTLTRTTAVSALSFAAPSGISASVNSIASNGEAVSFSARALAGSLAAISISNGTSRAAPLTLGVLQPTRAAARTTLRFTPFSHCYVDGNGAFPDPQQPSALENDVTGVHCESPVGVVGGDAIITDRRAADSSVDAAFPNMSIAPSAVAVALLTPRLSLPPSVTRIIQDCSTAISCGRFVVLGQNLGSAYAPRNAYSSAASSDASRAIDALDGFDRIEYAVVSSAAANGFAGANCGNQSSTSLLLEASCALHVAPNCTVVSAGVAVSCELDPAGWGTGFLVRAVVRGAVSAWSTQMIAYPPPTINSVSVVWSSGTPYGGALAVQPQVFGGSIMLISGTGLSPLSQLTLSFGGVAVLPFSGFASDSRSVLQPFDARGVATNAAPTSTATLHNILVCAPPGVGTVNLVATVGVRSSSFPVTYAPFRLTSFPSHLINLASLKSDYVNFGVGADALPPCALCFSRLSANVPTKDIPAVCAGATAAPGPARPPGVAVCPYFADALPLSDVRVCAYPDSMWSWSSRAACATARGGPPPIALLGKPAAPRVFCSSNASILFDVNITITKDLVREDYIRPLGSSVQISSSPRNGSAIIVYSKLRRGDIFVGFKSTAGDSYVSSTISFDILKLISGQPSLRSLTPRSNWLPRGGSIVNISLANAYRFGWVIVSPIGSASIDEGGPSTCSSKLDMSKRKSQLGPTMTDVWSAGPFVCPVVWTTKMANELEAVAIAGNYAPTDQYLPSRVRLRKGTASDLLQFMRDRFSVSITPLPADPIGNETSTVLFDLSDLIIRGRIHSFVTEKKISDRIVLESCSCELQTCDVKLHWLEVEEGKVPCHVTVWGGSRDASSNNFVTFSTPPWAGTVKVSIYSNVMSVNDKLAEYDRPIISNVTGASTAVAGIPSNGTLITISGENFGRSSSLGRLWMDSGASMSGRQVIPDASLGPARVRFTYIPAVIEKTARYCDPIVSWDDSTIMCFAPEGAAGQPHNVEVGGNSTVSGSSNFAMYYSELFTQTSPALAMFTKYSLPALTSISPRAGASEGGYAVIARGSSLSRFSVVRPMNFSWGDSSTSAIAIQSMAAVLDTLNASSDLPDASAGGIFSVIVRVGSSDTSKGSIDPALPTQPTFDAPVFFVDHFAVGFIMPPFEGTVDVVVKINSVEKVESNPIQFNSTQPKITSVRAFSRSLSEYDADPCLALITRNVADKCVGIAFNISDDSRALSNSTPCFRASPTRAGSQTLLEITGMNFGNDRPPGYGGIEVWLLPSKPARATATIEQLRNEIDSTKKETDVKKTQLRATCVTASSKSTPWVSTTKLECSIPSPLPVGAYDVIIKTAYSAASSSSSGITPLAVCACGTYATKLTPSYCATCPAGASCAGGLAEPRALADAWKTDPAEFAALTHGGLVDPFAKGVQPFFLCPSAKTCLGNNTCTSSNDGWACTTCKVNSTHMFVPQNGRCVLCDPDKNKFVYLGIAALVLAVPFWYYVKPRVLASANSFYSYFCAKKTKTNYTPRPFSAYVKIFLSYFQTIGAFNSYLKGNASTQQKAQEAFAKSVSSMLPAVVNAMSFFNDLGKSLPSVYCAFPWMSDFYYRYTVTILFPLIVAGAVFVAFYFALIGNAILRWARAFFADNKRRVLRAISSSRRIISSLSGRALTSRRGMEQVNDKAAAKDTATDTDVDEAAEEQPKNVVYWVVIAIFTVLPDTINYLASVQLCAGDAVSYLDIYPRISCYDPFVKRAQVAASAFGYGYLSLPLFASWALWNSFDDATTWARRNLAFMTEGYRDDNPLALIWEGVALVRTVLVLGLASDFVGFVDPRSQVAATVYLLSVSIGLHVAVRPYMSYHLNLLEGVALFSSLSICFAVMIRLVGSSGAISINTPCIGFLSAIDCTTAAADADPEAGSDLKLRVVPSSDREMFDYIAISVTAFFLLLTIAMLLDDYVFSGKGEEFLVASITKLTEITDVSLLELLAQKAAANELARLEQERAAAAAALSAIEDDHVRGLDSGRVSPSGLADAIAARQEALAAARAEAERLSIFAEKNKHWYRVMDHHGTQFWRNEELGESGTSAAELPEGASTTGGWTLRTDEKTGRRFYFNYQRYKSGDITGSVASSLPRDDIRPGPTVAARAAGGAWLLETLDDGDGREVWRNCDDGTRTSEPPPGAFTAVGGWRRIENAQGVLFWYADETPASCSRPPASDIWGDRLHPQPMVAARRAAAAAAASTANEPDETNDRVDIVVSQYGTENHTPHRIDYVKFVVKRLGKKDDSKDDVKQLAPAPVPVYASTPVLSANDDGGDDSGRFSFVNPLQFTSSPPPPPPLSPAGYGAAPLSSDARKEKKRLGRGDEDLASWASIGYGAKLDASIVDQVQKAREKELRDAARSASRARAAPLKTTAPPSTAVNGSSGSEAMSHTVNPMRALQSDASFVSAQLASPSIASDTPLSLSSDVGGGEESSSVAFENPMWKTTQAMQPLRSKSGITVAVPDDEPVAVPQQRAPTPRVVVHDVDEHVKRAAVLQKREEEKEARRKKKKAVLTSSAPSGTAGGPRGGDDNASRGGGGGGASNFTVQNPMMRTT